MADYLKSDMAALLDRLAAALKNKKDEINPAKAQRPVLDRKPVPWVGGTFPSKGEWAKIDPERSDEAEDLGLCIICGLEIGANYVYANFDGDIHDRADRHMELGIDPDTRKLITQAVGAPTATFVHPRCALQAAAFCPHLKKQEYPALDRRGNPLTKDELRKLANVHGNDDKA